MWFVLKFRAALGVGQGQEEECREQDTNSQVVLVVHTPYLPGMAEGTY